MSHDILHISDWVLVPIIAALMLVAWLFWRLIKFIDHRFLGGKEK